MISRKNRFHGHNSLRTVYSKGQNVRGPLFSLKYLDNPKRSDYRLAVVVSKKVNKSAVARNRIRRRIYEVVRQQRLIASPKDVVLTVYSEQLASLSSSELELQLRQQFDQLM